MIIGINYGRYLVTIFYWTKWRTEFLETVHVPLPLGPIFAWRGRVISGRLANRLGSRFGTNTKLFCGVIGPISAPNYYLNTVLDGVISLRGSCRNNALPRFPRKSFNLLQFSPCLWKVFPYKKGIINIKGHDRTLSYYDLLSIHYLQIAPSKFTWIVRWALNAISKQK